MKNHMLKNFISKAMASLLLVAMLVSDSSVTVLAETFTDPETGIVIENMEGEEGSGQSDDQGITDEVITEDNGTGGQTDGESEEPEEGAVEGEGEVQEEGAAPALLTSTGDPEDEGDYIVVDGEKIEKTIVDLGERSAETADGKPGNTRTSDFNAFSDKSRTDFFRKFYNQLSDSEKKIYKWLEEHAEDFIRYSYEAQDPNAPFAYYFVNGTTESTTNMNALLKNAHAEVINAYGCLMYDHPEIFWPDLNKISFGYAYSGAQSGSTVYYDMFRVSFSILQENNDGTATNYHSMILDKYEADTKAAAYDRVQDDKDMLTATITDILKPAKGYPSTGTIYEKVCFINDELTYRNYYNRYVAEALDQGVKDHEGRYPHVAPSALHNGTLSWVTDGGMGAHEAPVCESYANAFKAVCDEAGIPCIVVSGADHMWNYVQDDDGVWYAVDTTWDDPVRNNEGTVKATPPEDIQRFCMVGSATKCDGTHTFGSEHPANAAYAIDGKVPAWPTISTERCNNNLLGADLSTVEAPTASNGVITAKFTTDKTGRYYWVVREHGDTAPTVYDIQDGVTEVTDGAGNGVISQAKPDSADPFVMKTTVLAPGFYDLYIMQLTGYEYISNVIKYDNIRVSNALSSITLNDIQPDASKGVPRKNTLYVSAGIPVTYTIEPEELTDEVTVTLTTSDNDKVNVNNSDHSVWGNQVGTSEITAVAKFTDEDGTVHTVESNPITVTVIYPAHRIFEKYGRKYYATSETELYTGWLVEKNGTCTLKPDTPDIAYELGRGAHVYYFDPTDGDNKYKAVKGKQHIGRTDYLFGSDGILIKEWLMLESITINSVPAEANQSGPIDVNTLSYGASAKLTAVCNPGRTTDDLDPVWTSSDPSVIRVTPAGKTFTIHQGGDIWEMYANIDVLKLPDDPSDPTQNPVTITVKAGQTSPDNRKTGTIDIYVTRPVGWFTVSGKTYYGEVVEVAGRKQVEFVTGWWPNDFAHRNDAEKEYYFDDNGVMATGLVDIGTAIYDFGHDGVLRGEREKKGFVELSGQTFYYDDAGDLVKNDVVSDELGNHFFMDAMDGHMLTDCWIEFTPDGSSTEHYLYADKDGKLADGLTRINGQMYFFATSEDSDNVPCSLATGRQDINNAPYYFFDDTDYTKCYMATGYFEAGSNRYYALPDSDKKAGQLQSGWVFVDDTNIGGTVVPAAWRQFADSEAVDPYAEITSASREGWIRMDDGTRYYRNSKGVQVTGWQTIDGHKYYFNNDGSVVTGLVQIPATKGSWYYFGEIDVFDHPESENYGIMQTGRATTGGRSYFFNASGVRVTGWQKDTNTLNPTFGKWDFYDPANDGEALNAANTTLYSDPNWYTIGEARFYYINGTTLAKGWQTIDGCRYYFNPNANAAGVPGQMAVGVTTIGSAKYYLRETDSETRMGDLLTGHGFAEDKEYLANANGVLQLGWQKADGEWAFFDYVKGYRADDAVVGTDNWVITQEGTTPARYSKYYFKNGTTPVTGKQTINGKTYVFGTSTADGTYGRMKSGFFKEGKFWYYGTPYDETDEDNARSTDAGRLKSGFVTDGGITRHFNNNFEMQTGWVMIGGEWHYFLTEADVAAGAIPEGMPVGKEIGMTRSFEWYKGTDDPFVDIYFCFKGGSTLMKGWQTVNGYRYYFDPVTGMQITGVQKIANNWYDLGGVFADTAIGHVNGYAKTGWSDGTAAASDYYYNASGARVTGWQTIEGRKYYFRPQASGEILDGTDYGKKFKNTVLSVGKDRFVLNDTDGAMLTGYCTLGTKKYYTNANGVMLYGWQNVNGAMHYFRLSTDPTDPGAEDTAALGSDNFINVGGQTYYLKNGTTMSTGFVDVAGKRYYFDETNTETRGQMFKDTWFFYKNKKYYAFADGHLAKGYSAIGGKDYMFGNDHTILTGIQNVDGQFMFFDPDADQNTAEYGVKKDYTPANGIAGFFRTTDTGTIFYIKNGKIQTGWQTVEGRKYYFDATGVLQPGVYNPDTELYEGEFKIGNKIYRSYTYAEAHALGDDALEGSVYSGFKNYESAGRKWTCYYDANGLCASGWVKYDNGFYYFNPDDGVMQIGCFTVGNYMYFSDKNGRRLTGLVKYNNNTYFCDGNGIAKSGWQTVKVDGENRKFWFDTNGVMLTGLQKIGNYWYYFQDVPGMVEGQMRTGFFTIDRSGDKYSYNANSSGVLQFGPAQNNGDWSYYASEYDNNTYSDSIDIGAGYVYEPYSNERPGWYKVKFTDADPGVYGTDYIYLYATKGNNPSKGWQSVPGLDGVKHKYYFNPANGALMIGRITVSGKEYQLGDDEADLSTFGTFSADTIGFRSFDGGSTWYYFDANATLVTGWVSKVYGPKDTHKEAGLGSFYLDPNEGGKLATGLTVIGKNTYYLENRDDRVPGYGRRVDSEVVEIGTDTYVFGSNGVMLSGWQNVNDGGVIKKQYFAPELQYGTEYDDRGSGKVYVLRVGNNIYRLDNQAYAYPIPVEDGYTKGFDPVAGIYQDANAKIATGLQSITMPTPSPNSKVTMYFSPENGLYADNEFVTVGKNTYYFGEDIYGRTGVMLTGYQPSIGGENYLFASNGVMLTGWQKCPDGLMRLFDTKTGKEITSVSRVYGNETEGWYEYTDDDDDDRIVRYYLRNGKPLTGWQNVNTIYGPGNEKGRFYFNPDGTVAYSDTGEISVSNVIYNSLPYKKGEGRDYGRMTEGFYEKDGGFRYADANGKMITGWLTLTRGADKKKYKYYLSSAGMLCTGVTDVGGYKYYLMDYDPVSHADKRDPRTNYEFGALQLGAGGVIHSENPAADYRVNSSGVIQSGWVFIKNGTVYDPEYYDTKIDTFGQKIDVTPLVDGTGTKRTDWYTMDGDWYLIEGGKTLRKGNYAQNVTIGGVKKSLLFALDPTTGALYDTEGIFNIGNNRYYNTSYEGGPLTGYPNKAIAVSAKFTRSGKTYCANNKGVLLTGLVNETRNKVVYTSLYNPTDCTRFEGGMFTYNNNVYYAFTDDDETADRIPEGFEVGDLAKGRVTLEVDGVESGYWFDNNGVRKTGWASFREADKKTYKYYYDTDGRMLCDGQFTIAGKDYVFDADGKLYTGVYETADGSRYWSDGNGILYRGWKYVKEGAVSTWRYYRQSDGKELTTAGIDDDNKMLFMPGSIQGNYWGVVREDGNVYAYYINKNSAPAKNTWLAIDGKRYYFDASGVLYGSGTAMQRLSDTVGTPLGSAEDVTVMTLGANRFAVVPVDDAELLTYTGGVMPVGYAVSGFLTNTDDVLFYANANGQLIKGYVTLTRDKVNWKYYADTNYRILTGPSYIGANKYLFDTADNYGQLLSIDHKNALTGLVQSDGKEYLTDNNGVILTGWRNVKTAAGAIWYYFDPATGEKQTIDHWAGNWVVMDDGKVFYIANQKTLTKGFAKVYGTYTNPTEGIAHTFYFDASTGELLKAAPGDEYASFENGGYTYEVDEDGVLTVGWGRAGRTETTNPNIEADSWYDANGRMVKGAVTVTGKGAGYYYFDNNGKMVTGISKVNGKTYMYGSNTTQVTATPSVISFDRGKLHKNYYGELDDTTAKYKSDGNGVMMTGWQYFKTGTVSEWHYFDLNDYKENTTAVWDSTKNWCTLTLNEGSKEIKAKYYFKNNSVLKGFQLIGGRRYYFDTTGRMATGLWNISGVLYYFNETVDDADPSAEGMLLTNGITNSGGKYYYMGSDGKNKKGWFTISGSRYYADPVTGELAVGIVRLDGKNYFFSDADATLGRMQTGFFRISDFGQKYYDISDGASNMYYADANGVILNSGWTKYRPKPKDPDPQEWSFYAAPNLPGIDMGEFTLTGEIAAGDVLIDTNGLVYWLDNGKESDGNDGFVEAQAYYRGTTPSTTTAEDRVDYFRFDPNTGARRKEVLYFYGNYYGMDIDANQTRTINTMRCYMNTDMKYSTPSDDFIIVNNYKTLDGEQLGDNSVLVRKGLTSYPDATFPMCASKNIEEEKNKYKKKNDIAKIVGDEIVIVPTGDADGIVDVIDAEIYSKDVYDLAIAKYGPRNLILAGASSGAGICLGLYNYAFERKAEENKNYLLPEQVLLLSPWIDVSMTNPKCTSISKKNAGPTDVGTLKYWGERYTRTKGVTYSFATSLNLRNVDKMDNIFMYTGTYDPCNFDCGKYADIAKAFDNLGVKVNYYSGEQHGFMFFAADRNAVNVTVDFCRKVMTN